MRDLLESIDGLPTFIRVLVCVPFLDVFACFFDFFRHLGHNNLLALLRALLLLVFKILFVWIPGLIYLLLSGKLFR